MIALASDHVGLPLKQAIARYLKARGMAYQDYGTRDVDRCDYPIYGYQAARAVADGICDKGILCCGTGVGISLAANKVHGVRCVCCSEPFSAQASRRHNDTNMLALGSRVVGEELAEMIVDVWLDASYEGGRHARRVEQLARIEKGLTPWKKETADALYE